MKLKHPFTIVLIVAAALSFLMVIASGVAKPARYVSPPETARFKPGPSSTKAIAHCTMCHSADYISTQPTLSRSTWKAIVVKMQKVHGAPIPDTEVDPIVDYLVKTYGDEKPKS